MQGYADMHGARQIWSNGAQASPISQQQPQRRAIWPGVDSLADASRQQNSHQPSDLHSTPRTHQPMLPGSSGASFSNYHSSSYQPTYTALDDGLLNNMPPLKKGISRSNSGQRTDKALPSRAVSGSPQLRKPHNSYPGQEAPAETKWSHQAPDTPQYSNYAGKAASASTSERFRAGLADQSNSTANDSYGSMHGADATAYNSSRGFSSGNSSFGSSIGNRVATGNTSLPPTPSHGGKASAGGPGYWDKSGKVLEELSCAELNPVTAPEQVIRSVISKMVECNNSERKELDWQVGIGG